MISESEGKVFINGKNIRKHLNSIRNDMGLCPQENMVFPDLNVFEQIEFFGLVRCNNNRARFVRMQEAYVQSFDGFVFSPQLKAQNKTREGVKEDVNALLAKLKLSDKKDFLPSKLSGGQQRRLCLGMALIGNANV